MAKKITEITDYHRDVVFKEEIEAGLKTGFSTERADFEKTKAAIIRLYEMSDLQPPTEFIEVKGPLEFAKYRSPFDSSTCYGSHNAGRLAAYRTFERMGGELDPRLKVIREIADNCGWYGVDKAGGTCIMQDRPLYIKREDGLLHCADGPSVEYGDGFKMYNWRGTRIPKQWIENPESLTAEVCLSHENLEQRRCASEIFGWDNVLKELDCKVLDVGQTEYIGTLLEVDLPDIGTQKFLRVKDGGSERFFCLLISPDCNTALEAQAETWGLDDPEEYNPEVET